MLRIIAVQFRIKIADGNFTQPLRCGDREDKIDKIKILEWLNVKNLCHYKDFLHIYNVCIYLDTSQFFLSIFRIYKIK